MKKIICLALCLMICFVFASCSDKKSTGGSGANINIDSDEPLDLPEIHFGGAEFRVLSAGNQAFNDFDYQEESSLALDNAQYKRKLAVEETYGVTITEDIEKGYSSASSGKPGPGYNAINTSVASGSPNYDLCLIAGYDVSQLASIGYLDDMNAIEHIDLSKSWWDHNATESLSINGVVFFTTGEITVSDNRAAFCLMFNKTLLNEYDLDSPYELVTDGKWTIENFGKLCKTVSEDLNNDGIYDENDRYGLLVWDDSIVGIVNAAGQRCCTINKNGQLELTFYNETTLDALTQYAGIAYDKQYALTYQRYVSSAGPLWQNDQALFFTSLIDNMPQYREMESDFGILPYPKLNESQENYYTTIAPYNSQFICVPLYVNDMEMTGVITEALAYYGKHIVTPALYEVTLIGQSARDEESEEMLDIIFENLIYDIGYYYQIGTYNKQLILMIRSFNTNFTSMYDTYKASAEISIKKINDSYASTMGK